MATLLLVLMALMLPIMLLGTVRKMASLFLCWKVLLLV
jgi:hypothetical protein